MFGSSLSNPVVQGRSACSNLSTGFIVRLFDFSISSRLDLPCIHECILIRQSY